MSRNTKPRMGHTVHELAAEQQRQRDIESTYRQLEHLKKQMEQAMIDLNAVRMYKLFLEVRNILHQLQNLQNKEMNNG